MHSIYPPDFEVMVVGLRLYYLQQQLLHVIAVTVHIPASAAVGSASYVIHTVIVGLQTQHPRALILISKV